MEDVENFGEKLDAMKTGDSLFVARLGWVFRVPNGFIYQTEGVFVPDSPKKAVVVETKDVKADEVETKDVKKKGEEMTSTAKAKAKFRKTAKWKRFRALVKKLSEGKDAVTRSPLRGGFQLHHMDLCPENYENLVVENFCACNRKTHELIHFLFRYYQKDAGVIGRLEEIMKKMKELNG